MAYRIRTLILLSLAVCILHAEELPKKSLAWKIYRNECAANPKNLIHWNKGESFPSLGIGHFIWYPKGRTKEPFTESFPKLIASLQNAGANPPKWLYGHAPWQNKKAMLEDPRLEQLRNYLIETMPLQARFLQQQLDQTLPRMLKEATKEQKAHILQIYNRLKESPQGRYALLDYRNFKGDGTSKKERYKGKGWGLKQVLLCIPKEDITTAAFVRCAKKVLRQRVQNAPKERHEARWLKGWYNRLDTYLCD